jgi:uncharacterized membrane protein
MTNQEENREKKNVNAVTAIILLIIIVGAAISAILSFIYPDIIISLSGENYVSGGAIYDAIYVAFTIATDTLYIFGGGVIVFGALLVTSRLIQIKLKDPYQASFSTRYLSGYLTLGLNFFIGAELIRTVAVRTYEEFVLLILVIFSRGLFTLILHLEERWHGTHDTE